jgi:CubicO group peptidase (beta-lactamase class C family)
MTLHAEVAPGFEPVLEAFRALHDEGMELGSAFAVEIGGRRVVDLAGGWRDRERTLPWTPDTLVPVYSTTKPIGVLVLAGLVGRGLVDLEAPVAALWPEFGAHGKDRVTIAQALAHQAGVPGFAEPIDPALWLDPPALARALAALEPMWEPGTASGYHPPDPWLYRGRAGAAGRRAHAGDHPARGLVRAGRDRFPHRHAGRAG